MTGISSYPDQNSYVFIIFAWASMITGFSVSTFPAKTFLRLYCGSQSHTYCAPTLLLPQPSRPLPCHQCTAPVLFSLTFLLIFFLAWIAWLCSSFGCFSSSLPAVFSQRLPSRAGSSAPHSPRYSLKLPRLSKCTWVASVAQWQATSLTCRRP